MVVIELVLVRYRSCNSGGDWWLSDDDWKNLEKAGWKVEWYKDEKPKRSCDLCHGTGKIQKYALKDHPWLKDSIGKRCFSCYRGDQKEARWLGALATAAKKKFPNITKALKEFEKITGQHVTDEGCNCCGPPHSFEWTEKGQFMYCSGEGCLQYLYPDAKVPTSLREAVEKQQEEKVS